MTFRYNLLFCPECTPALRSQCRFSRQLVMHIPCVPGMLVTIPVANDPQGSVTRFRVNRIDWRVDALHSEGGWCIAEVSSPEYAAGTMTSVQHILDIAKVLALLGFVHVPC